MVDHTAIGAALGTSKHHVRELRRKILGVKLLEALLDRADSFYWNNEKDDVDWLQISSHIGLEATAILKQAFEESL